MLSFIFVIASDLWKWISPHYLLLIYVRGSFIKRRWVGIPLSDLTLPHFCTCPKPWHGISLCICHGIFVINELRRAAVVCFILYWRNGRPSMFKLSFHSSLGSTKFLVSKKNYFFIFSRVLHIQYHMYMYIKTLFCGCSHLPISDQLKNQKHFRVSYVYK